MAAELGRMEWSGVLNGDGLLVEPEQPAATVQPIASLLPTVDATTRDILNEWLSRRSAPLFRVGDRELQLAWRSTSDGQLPIVIELTAGAHFALLALDSLAVFDPLLVGEPFLLMPEPLRDLVIQRWVARALLGAPAALTEALDVRAVYWNVPQLPDWSCRLPFVIRRRPEGTQLNGCLLFEKASALQWLHSVLPVDEASAHARLQLPVPMRLSLGQSVVNSSALRAMEPGDVVWIENASLARDGVSVDLIAPKDRYRWRCWARQRTLQVAASAHHSVATTTHPSPSASIDPAGVKTMESQRWQVEVPVTFDLGELSLKTSDLELLQPGHIIELQQDVATIAVSLRVGDRIVARGSLVAVGKRLGVRIGTVFAQAEPGAAS